MLDKGYRYTEGEFCEGEQMTLQPDFAKSDSQFKRTKTLRSAAVANTRSGNERGVRYSKQSGIIQRGIKHRTFMVRIDTVLLVWAFQ